MTDRPCPHCQEALPEPVPDKCPYCGETIAAAESASPLFLLFAVLPATLIGMSPLYATWLLGPEAYGLEIATLNFLILAPLTLVHGFIWARSYHKSKDVPGVHWSAQRMHWIGLAFLIIILNYGLGFGGCLLVSYGKNSA